jgi:predicted thioesterase
VFSTPYLVLTMENAALNTIGQTNARVRVDLDAQRLAPIHLSMRKIY